MRDTTISSDRQSGLDAAATNAMPASTSVVAGVGTAIDPVCGVTVTLKANTRTESFEGKPFHFCSEACQKKFKSDPWFYASGNATKRGKVVTAGGQYTCPTPP